MLDAHEFIQVLRLMENFHQHQVEEAVAHPLKLGGHKTWSHQL